MMRAGSVGKLSTCEYTYWDGEGLMEKEVMGDDHWDEKGRTMISQIYVAFDEVIMSIKFGYLENGALVLSKRYGGFEEGSNFRVVRLNSDEYVTGLSAIDCDGITNLNIHTNQRKHGPFCDRYLSVNIHMDKYKKEIDVKIRNRHEFGGFFGSFHEYNGLKSIGIYVNPTHDNKLTLNQAWDPLYTSAHNGTLDYQIPTIVDGIPVKHISYKPKLKDRILSKLRRISKELFCAS